MGMSSNSGANALWSKPTRLDEFPEVSQEVIRRHRLSYAGIQSTGFHEFEID
jgi:hypothetical protein